MAEHELNQKRLRKRRRRYKPATAPGSAWGNGDFYMPGLASHGYSAPVPGPPDLCRRRFLERVAILEPNLLATLRGVSADDADALSAWAKRWNLTDRWCLVLARETARWYAENPDAQGWEFQGYGVAVGHFPFRIKPLRLGPYYHDPTWRRRGDFIKYVLEQATQAAARYCDSIEGAAEAAGLKRAQHKSTVEHFDWLARYQVKGESFAYIARNASYKTAGGRQTVRKAIVDLAKYIELTLRPSSTK